MVVAGGSRTGIGSPWRVIRSVGANGGKVLIAVHPVVAAVYAVVPAIIFAIPVNVHAVLIVAFQIAVDRTAQRIEAAAARFATKESIERNV